MGIVRVLIRAAAALAFAACSSSSSTKQVSEKCAASTKDVCVGAGDCQGTRVCKADGSGFGECACSDGGAGQGGAGGGVTGGSGGVTGGSGGATGGSGGVTGGSGGATGGSGGATGGSGGSAGSDGGGVVSPSCNGLAATCGPGGNLSCCASSVVPGGTYNRSNDAVYPATVSDFRLDTYEITVGRFRKFVAAYSQNMIASGAGKNPNNPSDTGWSTSWNASLPADAAALTGTSGVQCSSMSQTWTPSAAGNESRPINCITWYEAFAFCIWDAGRLPTEAEWNYAAAGGSEQRQYPWSNPPSSTAIDDTYAVYCIGSCSNTQNVGTKSTKGDGRYGQADLAGNVWEWAQDWYASLYATPCNDCANITAASGRVFRGGSFDNSASNLLSSGRGFDAPDHRGANIGARCSRTP